MLRLITAFQIAPNPTFVPIWANDCQEVLKEDILKGDI